jgi:ferritin-like metal-binding protein YciE
MTQDNNPLEELLVDELKDLYSAERQIVSALPKMAKKAMHDDLRTAFEKHLEETKGHVTRLERIAEEMDFSLRGKKCKGMEGLVDEGQEVISEFDDEARDAGLVGAAQKVEHYEIAAYGTARTHANMLGLSRVAKLLQQTLDEEARTDKKLTQLAESMVNVEALQEA